MNSRIVFAILIVLLLSTSCNIPSNEEESVTTPAVFIGATALPATLTPPPSETSLPPPLRSQPTIAPIEGTTSSQINVRAEPSTGSNILGMIPVNTKVEILGKDIGGNWYQINYPQGMDGKGWVTAKYVTIATGTEVPVVGGGGTNPNNGNMAIVQQQINVRSGPGTSFNSLGTLNAQDVVNLVGKDANGAWLQIEFPSGPDGKGWVNTAFVQAKGVENIPIITQAGEAIGTGTPTGIPFTPTSTIIPAWADGDSQNDPVVSIVFEPLRTHTSIYSGDVSAPEGDSQDWIQFIAYSDSVLAKFECNDHNNLDVSIFENGQPTSLVLACDNLFKEIKVKPGVPYLIRLQIQQPVSGLQYIHYTITIKTGQ